MKFGLLIQDIITEYSSMIIKGARKYCLENNIQLFVFDIRSKNWNGGVYDYHHYACKSLATEANIDGILLITSTYCQYFSKDQHKSIVDELKYLPLVSISENIPEISCVNADSEDTFHELLEYLYNEQNCRRFFFAGPNSSSDDMELRLKVFKSFMKEKKIDSSINVINTDYTSDNAYSALEKLNISRNKLPFDALLCATDEIAFGCIEYLKEQGIHIPQEVKISGFDNLLRCKLMNPSLTSIDMRFEELAYSAANTLHNEIMYPDSKKHNTFIKSKIVFRESTSSVVSNSAEESPEVNYFHLRENVFRYQYFLQNLQVTDETENIKTLIIQAYKKFKMESCICCIYDYPRLFCENQEFQLPDKAKVFFAYNQEKIFDYPKDFYLNPSVQMFPEDFSFCKDKEIIISAIFNHEFQYGYIAYTPGDMNYSTYELISTTTGISLATNIDFTKKVSETEKLSSEKKLLETETYFDEMTGVLNRRGLYKYGISAINNAIERNRSGGIIFGDMDHLKLINDNYGHEAGDKAIIGEVEILKNVFRTHDVIARLGGDEFIIVACGLSEKTFIEKVKPRLQNITDRYNKEHSNPFNISISLGFSEFTKENHNLDELMKIADENLYHEKVIHHKNRT